MVKTLLLITYFVFSIAVCSSENLPPCPPFVQYLPRDMPLNCVLPDPATMPFPPGIPPSIQGLYPFFPAMFPPPMMNTTFSKGNKSPTSNSKFRYPMPVSMTQSIQMPLPPPGMPIMPMPPMPNIPSIPPNGPIIVMPYYSRKSTKKNLDKLAKCSPSDVKAEDCFDEDALAQNKIQQKRHLVVTPVLSYVTEEGYIIYKKILSDVEALRWLKKEIKKLRNKKDEEKKIEAEENENREITTERTEKSDETKKTDEAGEPDANNENEEDNQADKTMRRFFAAADISDSELSFRRSLKRKIEKNLRRKQRRFGDD